MTTQVLGYENKSRWATTKDITVVILASLLIALFTNCRIFLPFSPVPISLQPHIVLMLGVFLGARRATMATMSWFVQGLIGFPVFSSGVFGIAALTGPTAGYLIGYVAAAYITGWIAERSNKTKRDLFIAMVVGNIVIYAMGASYLSLMIGLRASIIVGVLPFVLGDIFKLMVVSQFISLTQRFRRA